MSNDNTLTIIGRLTNDPTLRYTTGGHAVCSFGLAWAPRRKGANEWEDGDTTFFNCQAWRSLGENIAASLSKGNRVIVTGSVYERKWNDKDGNERRSIEIDVTDCGPALRWDQASVERAERNSSGGGRQPDPIYGDEEPF